MEEPRFVRSDVRVTYGVMYEVGSVRRLEEGIKGPLYGSFVEQVFESIHVIKAFSRLLCSCRFPFTYVLFRTASGS